MDTKVGIEPTPMGLQPISPPRGTWCILFKTLFFFSLVYTQNICIKKKDLLYVSFNFYYNILYHNFFIFSNYLAED